MKCTQYGPYGQAAFKNARVDQGRGVKPRSRQAKVRARQSREAKALTFPMLPMHAASMRSTLIEGFWRDPRQSGYSNI